MWHGTPWRNVVALGFLAAVLAACSTLPYRVAPAKSVQRALEDAQQSEPGSKAMSVGLCYNRVDSTPRQLLAKARQICPSGNAVFQDSDILWTPCSLQMPERATFVCMPAPGTGAQ